MQNLLLSILFICFSLQFFSCGDYAALEAIERNKKVADSLYHVEKDTISKSFEYICDSVHKIEFERAVDSIKILRLEGIKDLIEN